MEWNGEKQRKGGDFWGVVELERLALSRKRYVPLGAQGSSTKRKGR